MDDAKRATLKHNFDRAGSTYLHHNELQRQVAARLLECCRAHYVGRRRPWPVLLDMGCGPGVNTVALSAICDHYLGLDISQGMLREARKQISRGAALQWLQADMDNLAVATESVDVVFSSLATQWSANRTSLMAQLLRVLKPGGRVFIATLVDGTLEPMRSLRQHVDGIPQGNPQPTIASWLEIINSLEGLALLELELSTFTVFEQDLLQLLKSIRGVGAGTWVGNEQVETPLSPAKFRAVATAYERFRTTTGLPLRYEVAFLTLIKKQQRI